jgi:hypothetical protein
MPNLYHVSNWTVLAHANVGDEFTLRPGMQCAEGLGVYFSEGEPSMQAADGVRYAVPVAIIEIEAISNSGWWQSKAAKARKFGKARTWHSDLKDIECRVIDVQTGTVPLLRCVWTFQA